MFIKLTNASPEYSGTQLAIRKDLVVTVFRTVVVNQDESIQEVTHVFAPPHGTWPVQETFEEVMEQLS